MLAFVVVNLRKTERIVGRKVAWATATVQEAVWAMKKTYVEGRLKTRIRAGKLKVTSVFLAAPRPNLLMAMNLSRSESAVEVSGNVRSMRNITGARMIGSTPSIRNTHCQA